MRGRCTRRGSARRHERTRHCAGGSLDAATPSHPNPVALKERQKLEISNDKR